MQEMFSPRMLKELPPASAANITNIQTPASRHLQSSTKNIRPCKPHSDGCIGVKVRRTSGQRTKCNRGLDRCEECRQRHSVLRIKSSEVLFIAPNVVKSYISNQKKIIVDYDYF